MGARVFISYSHADEGLRDELEVHLAMLKRQGLVDVWHDRRLLAGDHLDWTISKELDESDVILLLVSPNFLASDYCYKIEKGRALERHHEGTARLISVILRPCDWTNTDLAQFLVTPTDGKPLTQWPDRDEAFLDVTRQIRRAIEALEVAGEPNVVHNFIEAAETEIVEEAPEPPAMPRSSNLRLKKEFSQADRDTFLFETFNFLAKFFKGSLEELQARNEGIETRFRRVNGDCFTATIYRHGAKVAGGTVRVGSITGTEITWLAEDNPSSGSYNESLSVGNDDQKLFLSPMGMPFGGPARDASLTQEGAAEYLWELLISPLQGS
ncbi:toll/interleukin-1 receptor domain-containing protein [Lutimaribacter sp. EGI FJ00015]|uniref:Toll/interleukin-1 receptor domain-containing protein n=1 Tax=Lutimaribacter degradans TaxID=2945989 RepID=A0ACC5ZSQ8_9RHOB|nr:toll/interleukin-1 receptor domain-containing protein [Lutimaribacter sp. EGI FJ00013]MCM2561364.1 toll/interleukin-1 receptor domain-containing protein [Lutimaribacter sp. EGI FJ00013]MCO0611685.1 toll/interleukin-1 receptor domain-containing protein [Lutimaribacter sp. EGI FJ00015]MCO0635193.1 toll/interleukin-1 receptor domain-containing protein [Lutimaribacter sp. EGI FJ00014]